MYARPLSISRTRNHCVFRAEDLHCVKRRALERRECAATKLDSHPTHSVNTRNREMALPTLQPGAQIGKYEVLAHLATGGMGVVYKARDLELGRVVALKVLSSEVSTHPNLIERFRREARHAARLRHKNIVTLYEFGQADGHWFLAMEFVEGVDLETYVVRKGQLSPEEVRRFLKQAAR